MAPARSIALAEVEKHVAPDDLWLVIAGKVYDVTAFMDDHPGGGEIMLNAAGKDGTDDFEDVGHSPNAYEQLKKFYIGEYAGGASGRADGGAKKSAKGGMTTGGFGALGATLLPALVVLLALLAAYVGRA
jgi:cytochrome b involved in lipid metabolism